MELAVRQFDHYALRLILLSIVALSPSSLTDRFREKSHHLIPRQAHKYRVEERSMLPRSGVIENSKFSAPTIAFMDNEAMSATDKCV